MNAVTWTRDSHGLFDYESSQVLKRAFITHQSRYLIRKNGSGEVEMVGEKELADINKEETTVLLKMSPENDPRGTNFVARCCSEKSIHEDANDKLWLVLSSLRKNEAKEGYRVKRGEILKLGRMRLKVKDYRIEDGIREEDRTSRDCDEEGPIEVRACNDHPKDENDTCRICFSATSTDKNPLLSVCKCMGTMKFIHFECLKSWLNLKLAFKQSPQVNSYYWKTFECEICKSVYPCNTEAGCDASRSLLHARWEEVLAN